VYGQSRSQTQQITVSSSRFQCINLNYGVTVR